MKARIGRVCAALLLFTLPVRADDTGAFDIVITNGHIIDGTGSPWYSGDVGIRDGHVAAIGNLSALARARTIDAKGMVVAPGFIDMLGQSECTILVDPRLPSKIYQGITTEITGEGDSPAPQNDPVRKATRHKCEHLKVELRLEHVPRVLCAAREAGHGHQSGFLRGCHAGTRGGAGLR